LANANQVLHEIYASDLANAKMPDQKSALAEKLLQAANEEKTDMAGKFALFNLARDLSIQAGDLKIAESVIDAEDLSYQIDALQLKDDTAAAVSKAALTPQTRRDFITQSDAITQEAVAADRYDLAKQISDTSLATARLLNDPQAVRSALRHNQQIKEQEAAYLQTKSAQEILSDNSQDADANLKVGQFRCFIKDDWIHGLPCLAIGSDPTLQKLAEAELKKPATDDDKVLLADRWWAIAEKETGIAKWNLQSHAAMWYRDGSSSLTGLVKAKVTARLDQVENAQSLAPPKTQHKGVELLTTMKGDIGRKESGAIVLKDGEHITTEQAFAPPVTFKIVAMTDSTNIRLAYAADQIIFNWESDIHQLRIDGGPADGRHKPGAGNVPVNQWVEIGLTVLPHSLSISIGGVEKYRTEADFSRINQSFSIFQAGGATVKVKSVVVEKNK
jgi:hypothetical protein